MIVLFLAAVAAASPGEDASAGDILDAADAAYREGVDARVPERANLV